MLKKMMMIDVFYSGMLHGRTRVDLNEPDVEICVDHEVVAEHLMAVVPVHDHVSRCKDTSYDALLDLRLYLGCICLRVFVLFC
jgi:hypothetical protein